MPEIREVICSKQKLTQQTCQSVVEATEGQAFGATAATFGRASQ